MTVLYKSHNSVPINQSVKIYIAPLQDTYSEALPTQAKRKRTVFRRWWNWEQAPFGRCLWSTPSYELTQTSPLAINSFTPNWKKLLFSKSFPYYSFVVSTPNTINHSRLTVCLPDSLDLDPLPIDVVLIKRMWTGWFPRLPFSGCCWNREFTITIPCEI